MNSRRETAAAHRPGRDAQRVLPTAPPSQREAEISHRLRSSRSESQVNLPLGFTARARSRQMSAKQPCH